jgi:hypothetical protein
VAGDLVNTRLVKFDRLLVYVSINSHQVHILFGDIKAMHHVFGTEEEVYFTSNRDVDL